MKQFTYVPSGTIGNWHFVSGSGNLRFYNYNSNSFNPSFSGYIGNLNSFPIQPQINTNKEYKVGDIIPKSRETFPYKEIEECRFCGSKETSSDGSTWDCGYDAEEHSQTEFIITSMCKNYLPLGSSDKDVVSQHKCTCDFHTVIMRTGCVCKGI